MPAMKVNATATPTRHCMSVLSLLSERNVDKLAVTLYSVTESVDNTDEFTESDDDEDGM